MARYEIRNQHSTPIDGSDSPQESMRMVLELRNEGASRLHIFDTKANAVFLDESDCSEITSRTFRHDLD